MRLRNVTNLKLEKAYILKRKDGEKLRMMCIVNTKNFDERKLMVNACFV